MHEPLLIPKCFNNTGNNRKVNIETKYVLSKKRHHGYSKQSVKYQCLDYVHHFCVWSTPNVFVTKTLLVIIYGYFTYLNIKKCLT